MDIGDIVLRDDTSSIKSRYTCSYTEYLGTIATERG
jgi:hypothetical protein